MSRSNVPPVLLWLVLAISLVASPIIVYGQAPPPSINSVRWAPRPVTESDNVTVIANVTSSNDIKGVSIYYRITTPVSKFNSTSDFQISPMLFFGSNEWEHEFDRVPTGWLIYFYISAEDSAGQISIWQSYRSPAAIEVISPGESYLYQVYFQLNNILLNNRNQVANISAHVGGYMPSVPDPYWIDVAVVSPYRFGDRFGITESSRFQYEGQGSFIVNLVNGDFEDRPYDQYTLSLRLEIPYGVHNLTYVKDAVPLYTQQFPGSDSWNVSLLGESWNQTGNRTTLDIQYLLRRDVSNFYPPLILMLTTLAVIGLAPIVSLHHREKIFDFFLSAVVLVSSAELSDKINPFAEVFQSNVFEKLFSYVIAITVFMIIVSLLPVGVRFKRKVRHVRTWIQVVSAFVLGALLFGALDSTTLPSWAIFAAPLLESMGSVLLLASMWIRKATK